jgi:hypothetical protein
MKKSIILCIFLFVDVCMFSQNIDSPRKFNMSSPHIEYLSFQLGFSFLSHHTGGQYLSGFEYHFNHISLDGIVGFYPQNQYRSTTKFIYGIGISLYQKDVYGFYLTSNYTVNGVFYQFGGGYMANYDNPLTVLGGYRISGKYLSLKVGVGHYWVRYISGMAYEIKLGIKIFNKSYINDKAVRINENYK